MGARNANDREVNAAHSPFGGSVATRVLRCPASVQLVANVPAHLRKSSVYADRGTACHTAMSRLIEGECSFDDLVGATIDSYAFTRDDVEDALRPAYTYVNRSLIRPELSITWNSASSFPPSPAPMVLPISWFGSATSSTLSISNSGQRRTGSRALLRWCRRLAGRAWPDHVTSLPMLLPPHTRSLAGSSSPPMSAAASFSISSGGVMVLLRRKRACTGDNRNLKVVEPSMRNFFALRSAPDILPKRCPLSLMACCAASIGSPALVKQDADYPRSANSQFHTRRPRRGWCRGSSARRCDRRRLQLRRAGRGEACRRAAGSQAGFTCPSCPHCGPRKSIGLV